MAENKDIWQFSSLKIEMRHQKERFFRTCKFYTSKFTIPDILTIPQKID